MPRPISAPAPRPTASPSNTGRSNSPTSARRSRSGTLVDVLVSGYLMFGKKVPHWVLAHGDDGHHIIIHDPWVEDEVGETMADAANLPVPYDAFDRIARYGGSGLRAAVFLKETKQADVHLGHTGRTLVRSRPGRHAAQDHHQPRLSRPSGAFSRPAAEGHQPVAHLCLSEPRLLCLAAGRVRAATTSSPRSRR